MTVFDVDAVALLSRELLRERVAALVAETSAWAVGLSDQPHYIRRHGAVRPSGYTIGGRALAELSLGGEEDALLGLGEARPGSFRDALNALTPAGEVYADALERAVLEPFAFGTCVAAVERVRKTLPLVWADMLDDLGVTGDEDIDVDELVRAGEWAVTLVAEAELLMLAALGDFALVDVEAEGAPLALVRSAEAVTRAAAPTSSDDGGMGDEELAGALFLADAALRASDLTMPVPPVQAIDLVNTLSEQGLQPDEIIRLLPELPVQQETIELVIEAIGDDQIDAGSGELF